MAGLSRRQLARVLESLEDFADPSVELEQYLTPPDLAAHLTHLANLQGDLDRRVIDLGTGTGMLAIAASLAGAERVVGIDVDPNALSLARHNASVVDSDGGRIDGLEWVRGDVTRHPFSITGATVVSNPPFGAQRGNRHADRAFLETARELAGVSYTIHNEGSQAFVESFTADGDGEVTHAFRATFPIERRFDFHTADRETLKAEVFRIEWNR
ncbi:METTL5 family protein [Natrarchaeobius chitinivorans]|uniref:Methyltransferase domain-containing protein n=1 Tax=Natrarchaeobius chitinivorans TaxID=1679083 RepID=A0A3N6M4R8_NATCH|nr:METTL5 family protein [Natrarchaeobius chitinivorans]RQG97017.1 methyltransferase domain-containing protein [Natrarchaeobius chitinivorans]